MVFLVVPFAPITGRIEIYKGRRSFSEEIINVGKVTGILEILLWHYKSCVVPGELELNAEGACLVLILAGSVLQRQTSVA